MKTKRKYKQLPARTLPKVFKHNTSVLNNVRQWFKQRGREERTYQIESISQLLDMVLSRHESEVICAMCPGAGKTVSSIVISEFFTKHVRGSRVITLTHGQDILRTQYANSLAKFKPDFTSELVAAGQEINGSKMIVTLPHTIHRKDLSEFANGKTLLIIDEGHQLFTGDMIQAIIKKVKPYAILILTGTPAPFVLKKTPMVVVPMSRLIKEGHIDNVSVELAYSSDYTYGIKDFRKDKDSYDLKEGYKFKKKNTEAVLDKLLTRICKRLKMDGNWKEVSHSLCKTMIVCRNTDQAAQVYNYFLSQNVDCAMSVHGHDKKSLEVERFMNSKSCTVLVVVYRGILGFDYAEMCNLIDMCGTSNINRLFQMMSRLVRKYAHVKVFYKVVPTELKGWYRSVMNAAMSLIDEEGVRTYNGKNFLDLPLLCEEMAESDFKKGDVYDNVQLIDKHPTKKGFLYDISILGLDGEAEQIKKNLTYEELLTELGVLPRRTAEGGPGIDKTNRESWIKRRVAQMPLNLTSMEFFADANDMHKKHGVYALTTVRAVHEMLGIARGATMTYEECLARFKSVLDKHNLGK